MSLSVTLRLAVFIGIVLVAGASTGAAQHFPNHSPLLQGILIWRVATSPGFSGRVIVIIVTRGFMWGSLLVPAWGSTRSPNVRAKAIVPCDRCRSPY